VQRDQLRLSCSSNCYCSVYLPAFMNGIDCIALAEPQSMALVSVFLSGSHCSVVTSVRVVTKTVVIMAKLN
jgi:hypothetical protein